MPGLAIRDRLKPTVAIELARARGITDQLFDLVRPQALTERPIRERHRLIFYLGHLEVFDWNLIGHDLMGRESVNPSIENLFAFGIDPLDGNTPQDGPDDWPAASEIRRWNAQFRRAVDRCLNDADDMTRFWAVIEHRLMHAETLAYMLHWLRPDEKIAFASAVPELGEVAPMPACVEIPPGWATLGYTDELQSPFAWDNEFQPFTVNVPGFSIDQYNVTNGQYLKFVNAGGYADSSLAWLRKEGIDHPKFWVRHGDSWRLRAMFSEIPLPHSWPVYVSHSEAQAYARWCGRDLPTEAQFHRAAFSDFENMQRKYPWGEAPPTPKHGNFGFAQWNPSPVGSRPAGNSAYGVCDLVGNGWEWTSTPFAPFPGFRPQAFYPGYSADSFDGRHFVVKGASPRTSTMLLRKSFRNWFHPQYPNIYATFRCVDN